MNYFKNSAGDVYAYDRAEDRNAYGGAGLTPMSAEEVAAHLAEVSAVSAPSRVTMRQARLALLAAGKLQEVDPAIDAMSEPQKTAARIEWDYSHEVSRDNPFVQVLSHALDMSEADLDELFTAAASM